MQPGRKLKILIEHGIRKAKTLLQLKLARNVNSKNKDLCKYIDRKNRGTCEEDVEGIVVFKALFAKVFTDKVCPLAFQVSVPSDRRVWEREVLPTVGKS